VRRPSRHLWLAGLTAAALAASLALAPLVAAHSAIEVGNYLVEVGWRTEPAYVGQPNAVQVTVKNHADESPVLDLGANDIAVVVSTGGTDSASLTFTPAFDAVEKTGSLGEYDAALVPTAPGDYTFHVTGSIHGVAVDIKLTSGDETFDPVVTSTDLEFPAKQPSLVEVATHLDRIDARVAALQSAEPGTAALTAAKAAADTAKSAADSASLALLVAAILGGGGLIVGLVAVALAMRAGRSGAGTA
jgi:hypothetical protein